MGKIKKIIRRLDNWQYTGLCLLVLVTLVLHFSIIMQPDEPAFDEKYYVTDANFIIDGGSTERIEHPPLGKLFIISGILIFGDNPLGWRFFSVIFGTICIVLLYLICRQLNMSSKTSYLATFLLAFENISFVQAGIAMLDVYSLTFMLAAFYFYLKGKYLTSAIAIGFSTLSKLNGILVLPVILLHWFITGKKHARRFMISVLLAPASFLLLLPLFGFMTHHEFLNPFTIIGKMYNGIFAHTFSQHPSEMLSQPWEWVLQPKIITYWLEPHYIGMISPSIWILIIPVMLYVIFKALKGNGTSVFLLSWFIGTYLVWIPVNLITDRISYVYYFYPTIGVICIGLALVLSELPRISTMVKTEWQRTALDLLLPVYLLLHLCAFVILAPVTYWWKVIICIIAFAFTRYLLSKEKPAFSDG